MTAPVQPPPSGAKVRTAAPLPSSPSDLARRQNAPAAPDAKTGNRWWDVGSTPDLLRALAILTLLATVAAGIATWVLADRLVDNTERVARSTGEVLVVNQQVEASFAEAHAAAVSVHLAGPDGDREQRRLYELAIERGAAGLEQVAAAVGDDPTSHEALEQVAALTTRYIGLVESARAAALAGDPSGDAVLDQATGITRDEISPRLSVVTERFQAEFVSQTGASSFAITFAVFAAVLVLLILGQLWLFRRFRRIINPPLLLATIIVIAWLVYSLWAFFGQQQAVDRANEDAYSSIALSGQVQELAFEHRARENTRVLAGSADAAPLGDAPTEIARLLDDAASLADSDRERAAVDEVRTRWDRYRIQSGFVTEAVGRGDIDRAEVLTSGPANDAFNGFNATAEGLLLDNREQFFDEVNFAVEVVRWLRLLVIAATVLVALLAWWGYSIRMQEYR